MVSPITVIDETSNDDDEIILNLNLEMTINDYDMDGRKNDALAEAAAAGRTSVEKATTEAERAVATAKAATERAVAAERAAATERATTKAAAAKAVAEIAVVKAAAEIAAAKAAAEIAAMKTAAERAAAERVAVEKDTAAEARRHKINIHVAGRIYPSAAPHLSLTVRDGKVTLAKSDDSDSNQQWYRFQKYSTRIKDVEGRPSFIFENNGTGLTLQHAIRNDNPVRLIKHNFNEINRSVLWTRGQIVDGAFTIRNVDDIRLELVTHNRNNQEGEKIISYKFPDVAEHQYWKFTYWK